MSFKGQKTTIGCPTKKATNKSSNTNVTSANISTVRSTSLKRDRTDQSPQNLQKKPMQEPLVEPNQLNLSSESIPATQDVIDFVQTNEAEWTIAGRKLKASAEQIPRQRTHAIPAVKMLLNSTQSQRYLNQILLFKELTRCFPTLDTNLVKFATIKDRMLIIATDDKSTHQLLTSEWPTDALSTGVKKPLTKEERANREVKVIIRNVHPEIDVNDADLVSQLKN